MQTWTSPPGLGGVLPAKTPNLCAWILLFRGCLRVRLLLSVFPLLCSWIHKARVFAAPQEFAGSVKLLGDPC